MKKHLLIIAVLIAFVATAVAQKDEYNERDGIGISLGGQCSNHPSSFYWAGKMLMDWRVFNNTGFKLLDISAGTKLFFCKCCSSVDNRHFSGLVY